MMTEDEFRKELQIELKAVVDRVHDLFDGPTGSGLWDSSYETEYVTLELPKALVHLVRFLSIVDEKDPHSLSLWRYINGAGENSAFRRDADRQAEIRMARETAHALHLYLHMLSIDGLPLTGKREFEP